VLASSAPIRQPDGGVIAGVVALQDITPLKALEREKDAFLASVAHDLRNPLATILGISQLLQRRARRMEGTIEPQLLDGLRTMEQMAQRMNSQIGEFLDISRVQMGRPLQLERQPFELREMLERLVLAYQQTTDRHSIRLETVLPAITVLGDAGRLERVVANLLSNAIKYSPGGGGITLTLDCPEDGEGRWAVLSVADQGLGIPAADLPHVFERFHRAGNVRDLVPGTGVGLGTVRQIVEAHGGSVSVTSVEGQGTAVTIRVPIEPSTIPSTIDARS
jgi:signal transduction histidine kinase